jgi:hypothetical protein
MKLRDAWTVGAGVAVLLAGCSGSGTGADKTSPAHSTAPPSSVVSTPQSSTPEETSSSAAGDGCVTDADYCDTFDDPSSGWPETNPAHYYAHYDTYLGGTYRMGERTDAAISQDAPYDVTDAANDYSVQVDVDATPGDGFGGNNRIGIVCWEHKIEGGDGTTSAFLLQLTETEAIIGLWDGADGSYHELKSVPARALDTSETNHLTAQCLQGTKDGQAQAQLSLTANGTEVASLAYAKSLANYDWSVGESVGLLVIGAGSDVFYDNFAVTGKCAGDFC